MIPARIQPFCRKYNINIGFFHGKEIWSRAITQRNIPIKININYFCLICTSNVISFIQVIEDEKKPKLKLLIIL